MGQGTYPAAIACNLTCDTNAVKIIYGQSLKEIQPYIFEENKGENEADSVSYVANIMNKTAVGYKYFSCNELREIEVCLRGKGNGVLSIHLDGEEGKIVGSVAVASVGDEWTTLIIKTEVINGVHGLFFVYRGEHAVDVKEFTLR